jgi:cyclase
MSVTRREFIVLSTAAVAAIPSRGLVFAQQAAAPPVTSFEAIRGNVGIFNGRGGTIGWLSNKDALFVIDSQYPDTAKICLDGLKQKAGRGADVLINTHHHGDHTGGNGVFKPEVKKIVAHARVPALLQQQAAAQPAPAAGATPAPPPVGPDTTFDKTWSERAGDETVAATHYGPGHTGGDAIIYFQKANVAHMGDLFFHERHPFIDRPAGASIQNWIATLDTVSKQFSADTIYIAGHAKTGLPVVLKRADVLRFRDYLDAVLSHARAGIAAKKGREEIVALAALPKFEGFMEAPPRLTLAGALGVAYDELTAK